MRTWEDNDFRLRASASSYFEIGRCLTGSYACGTTSIPLACGDVTDDIDGTARTCSAGDGATPGVYEMDP